MALTYGEISAITQKYFVPKLVDNIFASNALLQRAKKKWYEKHGGGETIMQPVAYATTTAAGRYSGADTLSTTPNDQVTAAEFNWREYYANITINRIDELKNSGKEQVINFVKAKVQLAEKSLADTLGTDLFSDGSTANSIKGLQLIAAATGTYGGIAKGTYSWWQGQKDASTSSLTIATLRAITGDATIDSDRPTVYVTVQDRYDDLYNQIQPQERYSDSDTAKAGFTNILFEGKPLIVDSHCASTDLFAINEKYLTLIVHRDEDFRFEPFIKPTNQNISTAKIYWTGALVCSNPRLQGWMSNLS